MRSATQVKARSLLIRAVCYHRRSERRVERAMQPEELARPEMLNAEPGMGKVAHACGLADDHAATAAAGFRRRNSSPASSIRY